MRRTAFAGTGFNAGKNTPRGDISHEAMPLRRACDGQLVFDDAARISSARNQRCEADDRGSIVAVVPTRVFLHRHRMLSNSANLGANYPQTDCRLYQQKDVQRANRCASVPPPNTCLADMPRFTRVSASPATIRVSTNNSRANQLPDEIKLIELWPCRYNAPCKVRNCNAKATTITRSVDSGGRPFRQYEVCQMHADQVAERERGKGRQIVTRP